MSNSLINKIKKITMCAASLIIAGSMVALQPMACLIPDYQTQVNADESYSPIYNDSDFRAALKNGGYYRISTSRLDLNDNHSNYTDGGYVIPEGVSVVIDLNGNDVKLTSASNEYSVGIWLSDGSSLTVKGDGSFVTNAGSTSSDYTRPLFVAKGNNTTLNLADAEFTNKDGYIVNVRGGSNTSLDLNITSGKYSHSPRSYCNGYFKVDTNATLNGNITGGYYDKTLDSSYIASGYKLIDDTSVKNYKFRVILDAAVVETAPEAKELVWSGEEQELVEAGTAFNGTMVYSLTEEGDYSEVIPKAADVGSYTVYYKAVGTGSTTPSGVASVTSFIKKEHTLTLTASDKEDDGQAYSSYELTCDGEATILYRDADTKEELASAPSAVGSYEIKAICDATDAYYAASTEWIAFNIFAREIHYTAPVPIEGLIYNGQQQKLVTPGTSDHDSTMEYALGEAPKQYSAKTNIQIEDLNVGDVLAPRGSAVCIVLLNGSVTLRREGQEDWTNSQFNQVLRIDSVYNTEDQIELSRFDDHGNCLYLDYDIGECNSLKVIAKEGRNVILTPHMQEGEVADSRQWSTEVPTAKSGGTYKVAYRINGNGEFDDIGEQYVEATIGKAEPTYNITERELYYTGDNQVLVKIEGDGGPLFFKVSYYHNGSWISVGGFQNKIPEESSQTTYDIYWYSAENENYESMGSADYYTYKITTKINKAYPEYTAPTAIENLYYSKQEMQLINPGSTEHGTILYSMEKDGEYSSETLPTAKDVGDYTVWYKIEGDDTHSSVGPVAIDVSIAKRPVNITLSNGKEYAWGEWVSIYDRFSISDPEMPADLYDEIKGDIAKCLDTPQVSTQYYTNDAGNNQPGEYTFDLKSYYVDQLLNNEKYSNYDIKFTNSLGSFKVLPYDLDNIDSYGDRAATITLGDTEFVYDGNYHYPSLDITIPCDKLLNSSDDTPVRYNKNISLHRSEGYNQKNAGEYSTTVTANNCTGSYTFNWKIVARSADLATLGGYSVTLDGNIGVVFYIALSDEIMNSSTAQMVFEVPEGSKTSTQIVKVEDAVKETPYEYQGVYYYPFKCTVSAKDMASTITAQIVDQNVVSGKYEFSVKSYAEYLLENPENRADFAAAAQFVKALLNYGSAAQVYFGTDGVGLANSSLSEADKDLSSVTISEDFSPEKMTSVSDLPEGVTFEGTTLSLKSAATLSFYFKGAEGVVFKYGNNEIVPEPSGDYMIVRIKGINARDLDEKVTLTVGSGSVKYCPLTYCYKVLKGNYDENLQNACKAIYMYAEEADSYLG